MRRPLLLLTALLIAVIALMAAKSLLIAAPPVREHPEAGHFDARHAKAALALVLGDQRPHPADTAADDRVRDRIVARLQHVGLKPIVRDQLACNELYKARGVSCARVRNVIAVVGPAGGKAVLLNAHYDSTPVGPGAADDGIGVATLLEVGSILKDQPLKRPVILLFNEGEELGLVGARAFLADPLSRNVGSLINLEARGVRGPVNMFETSRPNNAPVAVFAAAVSHPIANSLSTDVYRLLPNYTDVNSFSERGWLTLNLAPIGNETRYHSPGDDVAALDPATLQHMGDQTLALTLALANGPPRAGTGDRIFMDLAGMTLITLPVIAGVVLLVALLIGFAAYAWTRGEMIRGAAIVFGTWFGSAALSWLALSLIGAARQGMFWRAYPLWTHLATYASVMLIGVALLATIGRRAQAGPLRAVFWLVYVFLGAIVGLVAPGGIVFFLFPPLLVLIGMVAAHWRPVAERIGAIAAMLLLYLTWGAMLALLEELLNGGPMWIFAPLGALLILPILIEAKPLIDAVRLAPAAALAGALALLGWAVAAAVPAYSADRQQRFVIEHVSDASSGKSWWSVVDDGAPLPAAYRTANKWTREKLPFSERSRWLAAAAADPSARPPDIQLVSQVQNGSERTLVLRLIANGNDHVALIAPEDSRIRSAGVDGFVRPIDHNESGKYLIDCFGRSCDGALVELVADRQAPIAWLIIGSRAGLPASGAQLVAARPGFARPQYNRDETITFVRRKLRPTRPTLL
jgi:hypothetical protein